MYPSNPGVNATMVPLMFLEQEPAVGGSGVHHSKATTHRARVAWGEGASQLHNRMVD